jgi:hypothetical protein
LGGVDPHRKEPSREISRTRRCRVQHAGAELPGKVPAIIQETLRRIGVAVDENGGLMNGESLRR